MDQITIKTSNPKYRLYWCFIEFTDVHVGISTPLVKICIYTVCNRGGEGDRVVWRASTGVITVTVYLTRFQTYKIALPPQGASDR